MGRNESTKKNREVLELLEKIGRGVRSARVREGFSQKFLADKAGSSTKEIGPIERGERNLTIGSLCNLSSALEIEPTQLLSGELGSDNKGASDVDRLNNLMGSLRKLQLLGDEKGVKDVFSSSGMRLLQILIVTGLKGLESRDDYDAVDVGGNKYEIKTLNNKTIRAFPTHSRMSEKVIERYEKVDWIFAIYDGVELREIYCVRKQQMGLFYEKWRARLSNNQDKEKEPKWKAVNPRISLSFVRDYGQLIFERSGAQDFTEKNIADLLGVKMTASEK